MLVGLTGGIGSGKTAISNAFAKLGVAIVDTDVIARTILSKQPQLLTTLAERFGEDILDTKGKLIRSKLRELAFSSKQNKADLDSIMHPAIRAETLSQIAEHDTEPYCIVVVPLLIETNFKALVDRVLVVTAPYERRLKWLKARSDLDTGKAEAIISKQSSDEQRLAVADDHISNDGTLDDIDNEVAKLHKIYLALSHKSNTQDKG